MKQNNKEIVIINQDSGYLMIDIANAYVDKGYSVSLITGRLVIRNNPLSEKVQVSKIIKYNKSNTFKRLFTWSFASIQIVLLLWFKYFNKKSLMFLRKDTRIQRQKLRASLMIKSILKYLKLS